MVEVFVAVVLLAISTALVLGARDGSSLVRIEDGRTAELIGACAALLFLASLIRLLAGLFAPARQEPGSASADDEVGAWIEAEISQRFASVHADLREVLAADMHDARRDLDARISAARADLLFRRVSARPRRPRAEQGQEIGQVRRVLAALLG
ncbi:hypothetical protein [Brachybacterium hainanense]